MIGIFDSGMGGLTVLKAVREEMPSIDVLYFGDIGNAPYGSKSREEISKLTIQAIQLLRTRGARSIVSACNSVSASMTVSLFDTFALSSDYLIEMVGPTVSYFRESSARILLCATPATIKSSMYQDGFEMIGKDVHAFSIPDLAGAIERSDSEDTIEGIIRTSLESITLDDFDVLILACTHYPLVSHVFQRVVKQLSPQRTLYIFDPAVAVAERVKKQLWPREMADGKMTFLLSKDSVPFREHTAKLFPKSAHTIEVLTP
jgi:glutamate racemase